MSAHSKKGFTLIELLVVIAIIAILSVIGVTVFSSVQSSARDAKRRADLQAIAMALEEYKLTTGSYPLNGVWDTSYTYSPPTYPGRPNWILLENALASYMVGGKLPIDPQTSIYGGYMYYGCNIPQCQALGAVCGSAACVGFTLVAYSTETSNNKGCNFDWYESHYPGRYFCVTSQQ